VDLARRTLASSLLRATTVPTMPPPLQVTNAAFAEAFAPLFEVIQRGVRRGATPADLLEVVEPPRYVLKRGDAYLGEKGWRRRQREAVVLADIEDARAARAIGRREYGIDSKIVRVRRRGTLGIEGYALREGLKVEEAGTTLGFGVGKAEAMAMLAALTGGGTRSGKA
jgi:hypothetical protein